jgi:hypothetical protein
MSEVKVNKISPRSGTDVALGDSGDSFNVPSGAAIAVTGDLKSSTLKDSAGAVVISKSGTTVTLGASGDTVSLAGGATQSGFGRTGTVDWQTDSIKTGTFTAVNGEGYFINTSGGVSTMTLPSSPSAGAIVSCKDYSYSFGTNSLTVDRNGSPIGGDTGTNPTFTTNGTALTFIYVDGTRGWLVINQSTNTTEADSIPTGGTTVESGGYRYHIFTSSGDFIIPTGQTHTVEYVIIAGGGGGGTGGGGAGGMQDSSASLTAATYPVVVGDGGATGGPGTQGSDSSFNSVTSTGGGGGGGGGNATTGGSGGGGHGGWSPVATPGQAGTPGQGNAGGAGSGSPGSYATGGGGGGKGSTGGGGGGSGGSGGSGGAGDNSFSTWASATSTGDGGYYAGGGGGGGYAPTSNPGGSGGAGGGGDGGGSNNGGSATAAVANTGGGGGGSYGTATAGAAGIVLLRYSI